MTPVTHRLGIACLALTLLAACGGDDGPTSPKAVDLSGTWRITFTNLSGSGITCGTTGIDYVISQTGSTFTGSSPSTYRFTCTDGVSTESETLTGAVITNGQIDGSQVAFDLATSAAHQTGMVSGNSLTGSATWTLDLGGAGTVVLRGQFGGVRL